LLPKYLQAPPQRGKYNAWDMFDPAPTKGGGGAGQVLTGPRRKAGCRKGADRGERGFPKRLRGESSGKARCPEGRKGQRDMRAKLPSPPFALPDSFSSPVRPGKLPGGIK